MEWKRDDPSRSQTYTVNKKPKQRIKFEAYVHFSNHFNNKPKISFNTKKLFSSVLVFSSGGNVLTFCGMCTFSLLCPTHRLQFPMEYTILEDIVFFSFYSEGGGNSSHTYSVYECGASTLLFRQVTTHIHTHTPNILSLNVNYRWSQKKREKNEN